jgi:hypothetical protein
MAHDLRGVDMQSTCRPRVLHTGSTGGIDHESRTEKEVELMTRTRMIVAGTVAVFALGLGGAVAVAQDDSNPSPEPPLEHQHRGDRDAQHERMRVHMPDERPEECDGLHDQMRTRAHDGSMGVHSPDDGNHMRGGDPRAADR